MCNYTLFESKMGRKNLAERYYDELSAKEEKTEAEQEIGQWIVLYDFPRMKTNF